MEESLYTYRLLAPVVVVDGDTLKSNGIDLGFDLAIGNSIRLWGINTPESRTSDKEEKKRGLAAKARLKELVGSREIIIVSKGADKYNGRHLGVAFAKQDDGSWLNLNQQLVKEGHAKEYYGEGPKPT